LHRQSGGFPRLINVIADRAMLGAFAGDRHVIGPALVRKAASEVSGEPVSGPIWWWVALAASLLVLAGAAGLWWSEM
jgi:general secretion pathway protein A